MWRTGPDQPPGPAGALHGADGFQGRFYDRAEVPGPDGVPLVLDFAHRVVGILDGVQTFDPVQPAAGADALVEHGGVHHHQRGYGAAVVQVVEVEMPVQGVL